MKIYSYDEWLNNNPEIEEIIEIEIDCPECDGNGYSDRYNINKCDICEGEGIIKKVKQYAKELYNNQLEKDKQRLKEIGIEI